MKSQQVWLYSYFTLLLSLIFTKYKYQFIKLHQKVSFFVFIDFFFCIFRGRYWVSCLKSKNSYPRINSLQLNLHIESCTGTLPGWGGGWAAVPLTDFQKSNQIIRRGAFAPPPPLAPIFFFNTPPIL